VHTKVVVISLPDATDRRAAFSARARDATLEWSYCDARTELGPELTYHPDDALVAKARPLRPGELGCYASHYSAWMEFLASDARQMIVLEDDTIVDWAFLRKVADLDLQASGVLYLRLFAKRPCAFRQVQVHAIEPLRYLIEYLDYAYGTQAYVLARRGAERFVRHCRSVCRPIDDELDRSWDHGIPNLCWGGTLWRGGGGAPRRRATLVERALKLRRRLGWLRRDPTPRLPVLAD
jgi:glycosyl transferase family 25